LCFLSFIQVSPDLYGDNNTRLFTYWTVSFDIQLLTVLHFMNCFLSCLRPLTVLLSGDLQSDAYQATGCYNMLCSGFIQINREIAMGASIFPTSSYSGSQYDISILIWKVSV
jgi:hypothetical protein